MVARTVPTLAALYERDETAWLEESASLIAAGRVAELDYANLQEFLESMAQRDRREVLSRLGVLLTHLLKWTHQPQSRSGSWQATILTQQQELQSLLESKTLRHHAEDVFDEAYTRAATLAAAETGLPRETFPASCPCTLEEALAGELPR